MDERSHKTRAALLDAAEVLFAERGFAGTSNRELVTRAGVNLAAIKYHFGSKRGLYLETVRRLFGRPEIREAWSQLEPRPATRAAGARALAGFIRELATRLLTERELGACARFMLREAMHPSEALPDLIESFTRPHEDLLIEIIAVAAPDLPPGRRRLAARSIVGQVFHLHLFRPFFESQVPSAAEIARIADHLILFSMRGLGLAERTVQRALREASPAPAP